MVSYQIYLFDYFHEGNHQLLNKMCVSSLVLGAVVSRWAPTNRGFTVHYKIIRESGLVVVRNIQAITPICLFSWIQEQIAVSLKVPVHKCPLANVEGPREPEPESVRIFLPLSPASGCSITTTSVQRDVNKMTSSAKARDSRINGNVFRLFAPCGGTSGTCTSRDPFGHLVVPWNVSEPRNTNTMAWLSSLQIPRCHCVNTNTGCQCSCWNRMLSLKNFTNIE